MDFRFLNEMRSRRDEAFETARSRRLARLATRGRSRTLRGRIAGRVRAMSDVLGALAKTLES